MPVRVRNTIVRNIAPFEIVKAVAASLWKNLGDTFIRNRTTFEKFQRSAIGDMAKLSIKSWLEENDFRVIDWDDVRTSWRSQQKRFDLQVNNHNIEIRSSISKYATINDVLQNECIIHPFDVRVKEITIQAFFADSRCAELWICGWALQNDLSNRSLKQVRRVPGGRLADFFMMPFSHRRAQTMASLLRFL
jgi:hypothetical protein